MGARRVRRAGSARGDARADTRSLAADMRIQLLAGNGGVMTVHQSLWGGAQGEVARRSRVAGASQATVAISVRINPRVSLVGEIG